MNSLALASECNETECVKLLIQTNYLGLSSIAAGANEHLICDKTNMPHSPFCVQILRHKTRVKITIR